MSLVIVTIEAKTWSVRRARGLHGTEAGAEEFAGAV